MTTQQERIEGKMNDFKEVFFADAVGRDDNLELYDLFAGTKTAGEMKNWVKKALTELSNTIHEELAKEVEGKKYKNITPYEGDENYNGIQTGNNVLADDIATLCRSKIIK